jgi:lipoate-protein ligase B
MTTIKLLMVSEENISVYCDGDATRINTVCRQNTELLNVKAGGAYSYHWALRG